MDMGEDTYAQMSQQARDTWARMSDARRQYEDFVAGLAALWQSR